MLIEIKVPSVGESVTEALLAQWFKSDGDAVKKDEPLFVIETDKVTLEVVAEADGVLSIKVAEGETVAIGAVVGTLDTDAAEKAVEERDAAEDEKETLAADDAPKPKETETEAEPPKEAEAETPPAADDTSEPEEAKTETSAEASDLRSGEEKLLAPSVRRLIAEKKLDPDQIPGTGPGGRITKGDVLLYLESGQAADSAGPPDGTSGPPSGASASGDAKKPADGQPEEQKSPEEAVSRKPMSQIRQRIAARLLKARQNTAMLTTFNEIDMENVIAIRNKYKEPFKRKYGVSLGFMSFFIRASVEALKEFPQINAFVDGKDIIEHHYYHVGVAIGSPRGLVVPVVRFADKLGFADLEQAIVDYVKKIEENRLEISDMEGGTFTISNGGVYGSLLSTPILNTPQSAILGMHKIEKRPVVIDDEVVVRPMMYVALSYDHRIVDGREAVTFLKRIKECVENPERMILEI
jgi:2-oxoglutarate dehydrogenase E2 component (dihydrolipoamide succinyltransferase)